jgi:hypothetical protein
VFIFAFTFTFTISTCTCTCTSCSIFGLFDLPESSALRDASSLCSMTSFELKKGSAKALQQKADSWSKITYICTASLSILQQDFESFCVASRDSGADDAFFGSLLGFSDAAESCTLCNVGGSSCVACVELRKC